MANHTPAAYLSKADLKRQLGLTRTTLRDLRERGELAPEVVNGRELYSRVAVAKWEADVINSHRKAGEQLAVEQMPTVAKILGGDTVTEYS